MQSLKELRKLFLRPVEHILREQPSAGTEFENFNLRRRTEHAPDFLELARQEASKDCMNIA